VTVYFCLYYETISLLPAAAALSNKNSELSDVSKPLSSKDKTANLKGNHSSSTKESVPAVVDPLDGFDLNNYAGELIPPPI